jgi:hypothetical protein
VCVTVPTLVKTVSKIMVSLLNFSFALLLVKITGSLLHEIKIVRHDTKKSNSLMFVDMEYLTF